MLYQVLMALGTLKQRHWFDK